MYGEPDFVTVPTSLALYSITNTTFCLGLSASDKLFHLSPVLIHRPSLGAIQVRKTEHRVGGHPFLWDLPYTIIASQPSLICYSCLAQSSNWPAQHLAAEHLSFSPSLHTVITLYHCFKYIYLIYMTYTNFLKAMTVTIPINPIISMIYSTTNKYLWKR